MKPVLITALASLLSLAAFQTQAAGMQDQLDGLFTEMSNYTAPGAYETQRRSAYFGGRYTYKTAIFNENLISMQLPSARGGCGGIDIFGGSFSFINSDQIVQLLRQVAANAQGYAFQLAMDNMCPDCMKWMNELQAKMQQLNENMSNSCQLAQGLINDGANMLALKERQDNEASITASLTGIADDFGAAMEHIGTADTALKQIFDNNPAEYDEQSGSVVFVALTRHNAQNWFVGGDTELIETIMSMTGSVVVGELVQGKDNQGETPEVWVLTGNKLTMEDLIDGAENKEIYNCGADGDTDNCRIDPADTKDIDIEGLKEQILEAFTGANGIITMIRNRNIAGNLSQEHQNILASMPYSIGSKIFQLAPISPEAAEDFVEKTIDSITLEYIYRLVKGSFKAVDIAMSNAQSNYGPAAREEIQKSQETLETEYEALSSRYGSIRDIERHYSEIMENIPSPNYITAESLTVGNQE